jgi:hypothetical protein
MLRTPSYTLQCCQHEWVSLCVISGSAANGGALWKLGNKGLEILLAKVYVQEGDWGLLPTPKFPYAACGTCVSKVSTLANLSTTYAKD